MQDSPKLVKNWALFPNLNSDKIYSTIVESKITSIFIEVIFIWSQFPLFTISFSFGVRSAPLRSAASPQKKKDAVAIGAIKKQIYLIPMNIKPLSIFVVLLCLSSCKTKTNQYVKTPEKVQKRHGKWVEEYSSDQGTLFAKGKYKMGEKVGVWKTTSEGKRYQIDKIRKDITYTKVYHPNGKISERGQTKLDIKPDNRHWFYFGDWKYYDDSGKLLYIKRYHQGKKADSISFQK